MKGLDDMTSVKRQQARDGAGDYADQTVIDRADSAAVLRIEGEFWEREGATFYEAFASEQPDAWETVVRAKRAAMTAFTADRLRDLYASASIPLPEQFIDD